MNNYLIMLVFSYLFTNLLTAQQRTVRNFQIREVTVTAKRTLKDRGLTKTVIDSTEIAESTNNTLADLLSKHSPLFIKTYGLGSTASVSFRGTAASHTQVEWNGININNPMLGQVDFSLIPVWFIDRAELLHGGTSLQEGSGALGGSVQIDSQPKWDKSFYASLLQGIGSYGNYQTFLSVGGGTHSLQTKARYFYERADNNFSFLNTAIPPFERVRQTNADYDKQGAVIDVFAKLNEQHFLSLNFWYHTADRNLPHIMSYEGRGRDEKQKDDEFRMVGKWSYYTEKIKSDFNTGFTTTGINYYLLNHTDLAPVLNFDSHSKIYSVYNKYKFDYTFSPVTLLRILISGDHHRVKILDHITREGYSARRSEFGLSATLRHQFSPQFSGYFLLRDDLTDSKFSPLMPSVGLEFAPENLKTFNIRINATRNYHQPTLNDLYWLPGGNPDLKAEQGYTADFSAEYGFTLGNFNLTTSATVYASLIDNWIMWSPSEFRYWMAQNVKKVFARGVEIQLEAVYTLDLIKYSLRANYAITKTTNQDPKLADDESKGRQLIYIPVHKANIMVDAVYKGYYANIMWSCNSERFTTSTNIKTRHTLPGYALSNLTIGKQLKFARIGVDVQCKINNLFDQDYQAILYRAMPGRNYTFLIRLALF